MVTFPSACGGVTALVPRNLDAARRDVPSQSSLFCGIFFLISLDICTGGIVVVTHIVHLRLTLCIKVNMSTRII